MPFQFVLLWTDALVYLLLIVSVIFAFWSFHHEHLRAPWREVIRKRLGMSALVVLMFYLLVGLLDSVHFQEFGQTKSLLDVIVSPIGQHYEETYSAPLAANLYVKTNNQKDVRLHYAVQHLIHPEQERMHDIVMTSVIAVMKALVCWITISMLWLLYLAKRSNYSFVEQIKQVWLGNTRIVWREILLTVGVMMILSWVAFNLAEKYHLFGTTKVGMDVFYVTLKSIRTGLLIGTLTTLAMLPFAVLFGVIAGYFGGFIDDIIQYVYTVLSSIPTVLLIVAGIMSLQVFIANHTSWFPTVEQRADARLLALCIMLGITSWTGLCRLLRAETLKLREINFIEAAISLGVKPFKIITRHIIPNVTHIILITVVLDFSMLVLAEAVLSYVGVGVDPSTFSWGNMINSARLELAREPIVWWPLLAAFLFMFVLVLAANLFADAVRDAFDPKLRHAGN